MLTNLNTKNGNRQKTKKTKIKKNQCHENKVYVHIIPLTLSARK